MKIAIVGLGYMGKTYVETLLELGFSEDLLVGIDINAEKIKKAVKQWPKIKAYSSVLKASIRDVDAAIVAANTPSHHRVILDLLTKGVRYIFCEKPLGINLQAVKEIEKGVKTHDGKIYTAFLINFSKAVYKIRELMVMKGLLVSEAYVNWGKDRTEDIRPTPGYLEDEACHGIEVVRFLSQVNQRIRKIEIFGKISHLPYVNKNVQKKAHDLNKLFPLAPNSSSFITETIRTNSGAIFVGIHSSFLNIRQERIVHITLSDMKTVIPKYLAQMEFDTSEGDVLTIRVPSEERKERFVFRTDKVKEEIGAFLDAVAGQRLDSRLTDLNTAKLSVRFSDAVEKSSKTGKVVRLSL